MLLVKHDTALTCQFKAMLGSSRETPAVGGAAGMTWRPSCVHLLSRLQSGRRHFDITRSTSKNLYSVEIMLAALRGATSFPARRAGGRNLDAGLLEAAATTWKPRVGSQ